MLPIYLIKYAWKGMISPKKVLKPLKASWMNTLDIYGAFDNHLLIGIIGVHRERQHISLFFVLPHYHRRGIGTLLFDYMMSNCNFTYITVNSSTYAETFYTSLGFKKVGEKEINKGIVSIPMERNI